MELPILDKILEDDMLPSPFFEDLIETGRFPAHLNPNSQSGKLWIGHAYRAARECMSDPDTPMRLMLMTNAFLSLAGALPEEFIRECVSAAIEEIRSGKPGLPHTNLDDPEKISEWREKIQKRREERKKLEQ